MYEFVDFIPVLDKLKLGRLAHLARHAPLNARVNYAVGSSPTGSITKQFMK